MYTKEKTIAGKLVAIAGATGDVGEGLARAFLRAGATVLVLTRSEEKFRVLRQQLDGKPPTSWSP